jgi:membrane dipeptidase
MVSVFDGHNDALTREGYQSLATARTHGHIDLPRMKQGGVRGAIFAVFTPSPEDKHEGTDQPNPVQGADGRLEFELAAPVAHRDAAAFAASAAGRLVALERDGHLRVAREIGDLDAADAEGETPVAVLHLEGAEAIDADLEALDFWYAAGLRSLGPVWSRSNEFAHGVPFASPSSPDTGPGLTRAGQGLVRRCAELGIMVDLSHLNEAGFWDVQRADLGPLVASHSAVHALCQTSRNLTDRQLDAIGASGGLVGIVFACRFLRPDFSDDPDTPLELIARHASYVAERIGIEHVGLGSDFDGTTVPAAVGDVAGMPRVLQALTEAGFSSGELEAIAWSNWRRVLAAWWG